jgi:hypothetical protein
MDQLIQLDRFEPSSLPPPPSLSPPPPPLYTTVALALPPLATYPSKEALFEAIQSWSKPRGYAFSIQRSRRLRSGYQRVQYACDRWCQAPRLPDSQYTRETRSRGTGCPFSILAIELSNSLGWEVRYRLGAQFNTHNHPPSQSPAAHPSHRHLSIQAQAMSQNLFSAGK